MKNIIRALNRKLRREMSSDEVRKKSLMAAELFLNSNIYKKSVVIMLYMPIQNETDTSAIKVKAFEDGKRVVFPVIDLESGKITPYYAESDTEFSAGAFSVDEPRNSEIADKKLIDVVIVPGIAFDEYGARIGFGKGCYDGFLKSISAVKVGFCYEFQLCNKIFSDAHDINMDFIVTEDRLINCIRRSI